MATTNKVNTTLTFSNVRGCYLHLFKPFKRAVPGGGPPPAGEGESSPKYSALFLLDKIKQADQVKKTYDLIAELLRKPDGTAGRLAADKLCIRDGDEREEPEFHGHYMVSASNIVKPDLVLGYKDANGKLAKIPDNDPRIFSGCYFNAAVRLWYQQNTFGKRINAELGAVQYVRPGVALGNVQIAAESVFGEIPQENTENLDDLL